MGHHIDKNAYAGLVSRLNRFPQGAPPSELLEKILAVLLSEKEAELVSKLPIRPFSVDRAAAAWKMDNVTAQKVLDQLADRVILLDIEQNGRMLYCLPPPMAGFFEFSMMRLRDDIDQKALSELFHEYINVEEDFIRALIFDFETPLGRIFVQEQALEPEQSLVILDFERASEVIKEASHIGISMCYCRHKMSHMDRACSAPMDICMTFNNSAAALIRHGYARPVGSSECMDLLNVAQENNLVQFGENVQRSVNFICNCCGCCCEALLGIQRFGLVRPIHSNYIAHIDSDNCIGCGQCVSVCPMKAVEIGENGKPETDSTAHLNPKECLGCGVCVRNCPTGAIKLEPRPERTLTPIDTAHRTVLMAIETNTLQNLLFDNHVLFSHRAMATVMGVILKLPPIKKALANKQLKSRYLAALIERFGS